jgi:hypothetical protein
VQGVWVLLFLKRSANDASMGAPKGPWPFNRRLGIRKVRSQAAPEDQVSHGWIDSARWSDAQSSQPISKRRFDSSTWSFAHGLILSTLASGIKSVLQWSVGIVKRCEIDPMPCSNCRNLVDPLLSDESSSLRERIEPVFQSKSHAFE